VAISSIAIAPSPVQGCKKRIEIPARSSGSTIKAAETSWVSVTSVVGVITASGVIPCVGVFVTSVEKGGVGDSVVTEG